MKIRLWPVDVHVTEFGERAEFYGLQAFAVPTPHGPATIQYLLYRVRGSTPKLHMHAELEEWSFDASTDLQVDWMVDHPQEFRHALRLHLEDMADRLGGSR